MGGPKQGQKPRLRAFAVMPDPFRRRECEGEQGIGTKKSEPLDAKWHTVRLWCVLGGGDAIPVDYWHYVCHAAHRTARCVVDFD
jgi:hypothetical protein